MRLAYPNFACGTISAARVLPVRRQRCAETPGPLGAAGDLPAAETVSKGLEAQTGGVRCAPEDRLEKSGAKSLAGRVGGRMSGERGPSGS